MATGVHRLSDFEIYELSLVDEGANESKFLIRKSRGEAVKKLAELLKAKREKAGVTAKALAESMGLSEAQLETLEKGEGEKPSEAALKAAAKTLKVEVEELTKAMGEEEGEEAKAARQKAFEDAVADAVAKTLPDALAKALPEGLASLAKAKEPEEPKSEAEVAIEKAAEKISAPILEKIGELEKKQDSLKSEFDEVRKARGESNVLDDEGEREPTKKSVHWPTNIGALKPDQLPEV